MYFIPVLLHCKCQNCKIKTFFAKYSVKTLSNFYSTKISACAGASWRGKRTSFSQGCEFCRTQLLFNMKWQELCLPSHTMKLAAMYPAGAELPGHSIVAPAGTPLAASTPCDTAAVPVLHISIRLWRCEHPSPPPGSLTAGLTTCFNQRWMNISGSLVNQAPTSEITAPISCRSHGQGVTILFAWPYAGALWQHRDPGVNTSRLWPTEDGFTLQVPVKYKCEVKQLG